ncbi:MAG: hypothetical protein Q7N87_02490 [Candidatus Uhrbacteria bacterium]|nr:hypothetical protein [Candidatus Uhrbacteria bacterium]
MTIISLEEARRRLGEGVLICLEPEATLVAKREAGKESDLWAFDSATGVSRRGDQRFFEVRMVDRGGYNQLAIYQEPGIPESTDGSPRVIGYVFIELNTFGRLYVDRVQGLAGTVLQLFLGSRSNPKTQQPKEGETPIGHFYADPQRLTGVVAVYRRSTNWPEPDVETMSVAEFRAQSRDGRSLAALAIAGLV